MQAPAATAQCADPASSWWGTSAEQADAQIAQMMYREIQERKQDAYVSACYRGDIAKVKAMDNEPVDAADEKHWRKEGWPCPPYHSPDDRAFAGYWEPRTPLQAAVLAGHVDVVKWLLAHGACPNHDGVLQLCAHRGTPELLELLVDAGGRLDLLRASNDVPGGPLTPLFAAVSGTGDVVGKVRVLLAQPLQPLRTTCGGQLPEEAARAAGQPEAAELIVAERARRRGRGQSQKLAEVYAAALGSLKHLAAANISPLENQRAAGFVLVNQELYEVPRSI